ncbi:MAG: hypothetical protein B7Y15_13335 [Bacteroidetes bacterium 24-39-8]|jgi:hypothetical protein|nr:MAG: hypothetical protein B7Y15_13335 [Bacteroidetes bacterium 24-39-8]
MVKWYEIFVMGTCLVSNKHLPWIEVVLIFVLVVKLFPLYGAVFYGLKNRNIINLTFLGQRKGKVGKEGKEGKGEMF